MKSELKENMYVRTKDGEIHKIKSINDEYIEYENGFGIPYELKEYIVKSSYKIIDLIEIDDFINGMRISEIKSNKNGILKCMVDSDYEFITTIINSEVESVLTKEQFESIEYKVG